jgi:hypothetical protein
MGIKPRLLACYGPKNLIFWTQRQKIKGFKIAKPNPNISPDAEYSHSGDYKDNAFKILD